MGCHKLIACTSSQSCNFPVSRVREKSSTFIEDSLFIGSFVALLGWMLTLSYGNDHQMLFVMMYIIVLAKWYFFPIRHPNELLHHFLSSIPWVYSFSLVSILAELKCSLTFEFVNFIFQKTSLIIYTFHSLMEATNTTKLGIQRINKNSQ